MSVKKEFQEIFSKKVRAGRRTYFFDVRATKAEDYYMTITESVKDTNDDSTPSYRKHKIFLYKEDFNNFKEAFEAVSEYIITEKGEKIISTKNLSQNNSNDLSNIEQESSTNFTEVSFDDLGKD